MSVTGPARIRMRHVAAIVFIAAVSHPLVRAYSGLNLPSFIGIGECRRCHEAEGIGNQYKAWASTPHARAYQLLQEEKAMAIAGKVSAGNPAANTACLKCHTTGGGKTEGTRTEGVGCEACHGPGSLYHEFSNHASFDNREASYRKAVSLGMYPVIGIDGIKAREKLCRFCHNEDRPCLPDSMEERKRQRLPLSLIADFVFKHPVRR
jgi:hypothetical protein